MRDGSRVIAGLVIALVTIVTLVTVVPRGLFAHQFEHPKSVRLGLTPNKWVLGVDFDVSPGPEATAIRSRFDRNTDHRLDADEQQRLFNHMRTRSLDTLRVIVENHPVRWTLHTKRSHQLDRSASSDLMLGASWVLTSKISPADRLSVRIVDRSPVVVPLTVDVPAPWHLELASQGEWHPEFRHLRTHLEPGVELTLKLIRTSTSGPKT